MTIPNWHIWYAAWLKAQTSASKAAKARAAAAKAEKARQAALIKKLAAHKIPHPLAGGKVEMLPGITAVRLSYLLASRKTGVYSRHVYVVQGWLIRVKCYTGARDGRWGKVTQAAYDRFRTQIRWGGNRTGAPGMGSLIKLGAIVRTLYPIKEQ